MFFETYIEDGALPDYNKLLSPAGLSLELAAPDAAWIGGEIYAASGSSVTISSNTLKGTPLYLAGLDRGDEILKIGRFEINEVDDIAAALGRQLPGDELAIKFIQRGQERSAVLKLAADPTLEIKRVEGGSDRVQRRQRQFREAWLGAASD